MTLGLLELVSSFTSPYPRSSLLPLMFSPSPSSVSVLSREMAATSPFGMSAFSTVSVISGRISGSANGGRADSICASFSVFPPTAFYLAG